MLKAINGAKTILTTEKMFRLVYQAQGYVLETEAPEGLAGEKTFQGMGLAELKDLAKAKGIANASKMKAAELIAALTGFDEPVESGGRNGEATPGN